MAFLGEDTADPVLNVTFGAILDPYQPPLVQLEVHSMLATFQPLAASDLAEGAAPIPLLPAPGNPPSAGYQYKDALAITKMVQQEIQDPSPLISAHVPLLAGLASGSIIADLITTYGNCVTVRRLSKI